MGWARGVHWREEPRHAGIVRWRLVCSWVSGWWEHKGVL